MTHPATTRRQQCERDVLASLGRVESAARMQARGEVNQPYVDRKKDEFKQVLQRFQDACHNEMEEVALD